MKSWITLIFLGLSLSAGAAIKVMTIGDSMTEEYHFEVPFSAPDSNPAVANTLNWVEILASRRAADLDFGSYESSLAGYLDYRDAGYKYNWGIPGYDTVMWMDIIHASNPLTEPLEWLNRQKMQNQYDEVDVIVIMVGGNDVNFQYGDLYDGSLDATTFINTIITNLGDIFDEIRDTNTTVPIVLANIPDLGATPDIIADHPDAIKRASVTTIITNLNVAVAALATSRGATLAPITQLTDAILSPDPLYIGALQMIKGKNPENPPLYLFCKAGLHPSTNGQAIMANILLGAINTATGSNVPLLPDREIITELLGLDPNQPFIDWATAKGLADLSMNADIDGDGIPHIGEYLLDLDPFTIENSHLPIVQNISEVPTLTLNYTPDPAAARLADVIVTQSSNLLLWNPVPPSHLIDLGGGTHQARFPVGSDPWFFRMEFPLKP